MLSINDIELTREENRDLVICVNCRWSASLLIGSTGFSTCPVCGNNVIETIPVNDHEKYDVKMKERTGFEIEFSNDD